MDAVDSTRAFVKGVKRVIIKVGTAVVTRADGRLALGRLGALCEQIHELNSQGFEVILVTSGAVGVGRQRLRYRKLVNSSFADLQKPQIELDGKACAAVGQNGLLALYDTLFSQLDVTSAQLLVTDNDFRDPEFRKQLTETVESLLNLKVIPIFNENDAVSTRKAPYEDASGIFWDNDSLAALLALELKADLLVLLSDVEGLYSGPPSDPQSKLIHTYIKEMFEGLITFGDKSRVGRGGMTAKVKAAVYAAHAGIPVVITSGYATNNIIKVLQGERIGTLFHRDAQKWAPVGDVGARDMAVAARESSRRLQAMSPQDRSKILLDVADALEANEKLITIENEADLAAAQQAGYEKYLPILFVTSQMFRNISDLSHGIEVLQISLWLSFALSMNNLRPSSNVLKIAKCFILRMVMIEEMETDGVGIGVAGQGGGGGAEIGRMVVVEGVPFLSCLEEHFGRSQNCWMLLQLEAEEEWAVLNFNERPFKHGLYNLSMAAAIYHLLLGTNCRVFKQKVSRPDEITADHC
ncbi:delta 1-pyrroline-5-carboxylate synthase 2 [Actinidia rufa]|uniref:Delta 1-pyrroline-5-carboxylate synthase 2 n=1 Tax=Actinidia rufa TaxID=165716 RepID=A0A7J0E6N8_9ERIC|nr:delta 1-pyrroline-5-carboxylate synthase 2 [Actinidia rufa]